jgi:enoyl-[acyl-carrier-protein] reductase (NADH)
MTGSPALQGTRAVVFGAEQMIVRIASLNFLKVPASVTDIARAAVFLASDRARMMTGTVVNSTAGAAAD